jgi:carboxyl-terminal processing protease
MRRFSKILAFIAACSAALVLTVRHGGDGIRVGADSQLRAAMRSVSSKYDLSQLPIFSKTLFYVRENYFDKNRLDPKRMLVGALDFVQRDVPEILIDRWPEHDPKQVTVKVNGQQRSFSIERVDAPWSLRSTLQEIFRFVQPNLQPVPEKEEARRLVEIEMAATNGMLYTLDPHSVLLDVETYKDMRTQTQGKFGGLGIVIEMDKKNRITVKRPMPDTPAIRVGIKAKDHIVRINNESTVNMTLNEAVERLRGDVDTNVDVYIDRDNVAGVKKFTITRAFIRPPSIRPAGPGARGAGGARAAGGQDRLLPHAALLGQQRRRPRRRAGPVRAREGQGHHHGPARQPGRALRAGPEGVGRLHQVRDAGVDGRGGWRPAQGRDRHR